MNAEIKLPKRLDTANTTLLKNILGEGRGKNVEIDASEVSYVGALGLQILISARRTWKSEANHFAIRSPSEPLLMTCQLLGVSMDEIGYQLEGNS